MSISLFKYLFLLFCLFWGVGDFFFFLSFGEGLKWISQTKNPAALQWIFGERLFPRFPRRSGGCQIIVVIPLQLLSLTLIQCFDVFQTPAVVFLKCAQQRKRFTYTNANKCSLRSSQYELQYIYRYSKGLNKMH